MKIGNVAFKVIAVYFIACVICYLILLGVSAIFDLEGITWVLYNYLHTNFAMYEDVYKYDFNPLLGDVLIFWVLVVPAIATVTLLVLMRRVTRRRKA